MTYAELLAKLKKGEALTAEEVTELEKTSRPAERFNEVSSQKQALETEVKTLKGQIAEKDAALALAGQESEDKFNAQLRELSGRVETLTGENQSLKTFKEQSEKQAKVNRIASVDCKEYTQAAFADPDYLAVLLDKQGVDLDDKDAVKAAITKIKTEKPEQFLVDIKGGVGAGGAGGAGGGVGGAEKHDDKAPDFSKMSADDRVAYIAANGWDAFTQSHKKD